MQTTNSSLILKYSYLIFCSFLLLSSCANKEAVQSRRYLISNAEKLGMVNPNYNSSVTEEKTIYHKIFRNYQGSSAYSVKKTPKNNPYLYHKKQNISKSTELSTPVLNPKTEVGNQVKEQKVIINQKSNNEHTKPITDHVATKLQVSKPQTEAAKTNTHPTNQALDSASNITPPPAMSMPDVKMPENDASLPNQAPAAKAPIAEDESQNITPPPAMSLPEVKMPENDASLPNQAPAAKAPIAEDESQNITPPPAMSLPEIKTSESEETEKLDPSVTILPALSSLFKDEQDQEDNQTDKPLEDIIAQATDESDDSNNVPSESYDPTNDNATDITEQNSLDIEQDAILIPEPEAEEDILKNKAQKPIDKITNYNQDPSLLKEDQLFKTESLGYKNETLFVKKYLGVERTLLLNNYAQLAAYSNLY